MNRSGCLIHHILDPSERFQTTAFSNQWILLGENDANRESYIPSPSVYWLQLAFFHMICGAVHVLGYKEFWDSTVVTRESL